jgi:hypothetical protein
MLIYLGHATIATLVFLAAATFFGICLAFAGAAICSHRVAIVRRLFAIASVAALIHTLALFVFALASTHYVLYR